MNLPSVGTNLQDQTLVDLVYLFTNGVNLSEATTVNEPISLAVSFLELSQVLGQYERDALHELQTNIKKRAGAIVESGGFVSQKGLEKIFKAQADSFGVHKGDLGEIVKSIIY